MDRDEIHERIGQYLEKVHLIAKAKDSVITLSGGKNRGWLLPVP